MHNFHSQCHYFAVAADMFNAFRRQAKKLGLFAAVDFSEIDGFPWGDHKDVRNMRSHVTEYFGGKGRDRDRWIFETPDGKADASSVVGTLIGGRLDWAALGAAAERLLPKLLREPIPYPAIPNMPPPPKPALPLRFVQSLAAMTRGNMAAAHKWMMTPNPDLDGNIPAEKVKTPTGLAEVVACLDELVDPTAHAEYLLSLAEAEANGLASLRRPAESFSEVAIRLQPKGQDPLETREGRSNTRFSF